MSQQSIIWRTCTVPKECQIYCDHRLFNCFTVYISKYKQTFVRESKRSTCLNLCKRIYEYTKVKIKRILRPHRICFGLRLTTSIQNEKPISFILNLKKVLYDILGQLLYKKFSHKIYIFSKSAYRIYITHLLTYRIILQPLSHKKFRTFQIMNLNKTPASTFQRDSELIRQTVVRPSRHPPPRATREATRPPSPASPSLLRLAAARAAARTAVAGLRSHHARAGGLLGVWDGGTVQIRAVWPDLAGRMSAASAWQCGVAATFGKGGTGAWK